MIGVPFGTGHASFCSARITHSAQRSPSTRLTFTYPGFDSGGPSDNKVQYLEWMFH